METIKVNMSPNPLDVQTIHASQNDGEARQWGFKLHNNGDVIDSSEVTDQMVFKAYKGGTEQLLPENTSTPVTSPFNGDIRYPQGLLADQEFTYRQSPTESDGLAKITDIKGNTLTWNQLIRNGNFADTSKWTKGSGASSFAISNNEAVITIGGTWNNDIRQNQGASFISGHKYFASFEAKATTPITVALATFNATPEINFATLRDLQTTFKKIASIVTAQSNATDFRIVLDGSGSSYVGETFTVRNVQIIDLTAMGLDITSPSDFTSLFPLPYYDYNAGALLSFNGTGLKTTGKNQLNPSVFDYGSVYEYSNGNLTVKSSDPRAWTTVSTFHLKKGNYIFTRSVPNGICDIRFEYENFATSHLIANQLASYPFTVTQDTDVKIKVGYSYSSYPFTTNVMIRFADTDSTFEPYTSSTLSLPISTYFPSGMKSAGTVYDELTESKAITRISRVDLGSLNWIYVSSGYFRTDKSAFGMKEVADAGIKTALYETVGSSGTHSTNMTIWNIVTQVRIINQGYTDANAFKTAMNGVYLYYDLATPTETSFTTASLVTENAEIPLSNNDGTLIGKCTEQLSENPGFIDAKIKLSDSDGECYSNKIQLHVERSPQ